MFKAFFVTALLVTAAVLRPDATEVRSHQQPIPMMTPLEHVRDKRQDWHKYDRDDRDDLRGVKEFPDNAVIRAGKLLHHVAKRKLPGERDQHDRRE